MSPDTLEWSEVERAPGGYWCRATTVPCEHQACRVDGVLDVLVVTRTEGPLPPELAARVAAIAAQPSTVVEAVVAYLRTTIAQAPGSVGLDAAIDADDDDISGLAVHLHEDDEEWMVQVRECPVPAADPYGVFVRMRGLRPVGIEDLSDAAEVAVDD